MTTAGKGLPANPDTMSVAKPACRAEDVAVRGTVPPEDPVRSERRASPLTCAALDREA